MERPEVMRKSPAGDFLPQYKGDNAMNDLKELVAKVIFFLSSLVALFGIFFICFFIFSEGLPFIFKVGFKEFILGTTWAPTNTPPSYGILPMIVSSIYVTFGAVIVGVPLGILTSVYLEFYASEKMKKLLVPAVNLMSGIPSIVYGFFALTVMVPIVRKFFGGTGMCIFTAAILLGIMILPTIIGLSQTALASVNPAFLSGSYALGASKERTIFNVAIPAASSGIIASVILGIGRAIGETMAVILVAGNQTMMPNSIFKGARTMTTNIVMDMAYAAGDHREALIATGAVLFVFILLINIAFMMMKKRGEAH